MKLFFLEKYCFLFALRVSLSITISWYLCYILAITNLSAAIITAVVISITQNHGESLFKSITRLSGTLFGAFFVLLISGPALVDAYLYTIFFILFILICIFFSSISSGNRRYFFILASITVASTGLVGVNSPSIYGIYSIVEERISGIIIAILVCESLNFIIPGKDGIQNYAENIHDLGKSIKENIVDSLSTYEAFKEYDYLKFLSSHYEKSKSLEISNLIYNVSAKDNTLNYLKNINIQTTKIGLDATRFSSIILWSIKNKIINIKNFEKLYSLTGNKDFSSKESNANNKYSNIFKELVNKEISDGFEKLKWLEKEHKEKDVKKHKTKISSFIPIYWKSPFLNLFRASLGLGLISLFWFSTNNSFGVNILIFSTLLYALVTMLPIMANKVLNIIFLLQVLISICGFFIQFYVLPSLPSFEAYIIPMGFVFFFLAVLFYRGGIFGISSLFIMTFFNSYVSMDVVPSYDVQYYLNSSFSNLFAIIVMMTTYYIIKEENPNSLSSKILRDFAKEAKSCIYKRHFLKFRVNMLFSISKIDFSSSNNNLFLLSSLDTLVLISSLLSNESLEKYKEQIDLYLDEIYNNKFLTKKDYAFLSKIIKDKLTSYSEEENLEQEILAKLIFLDFKLDYLLSTKEVL